jgi:mRNA interferase RelE/StbE
MAGSPYRLKFSAKASRQFKTLPPQVQKFLQPRFDALAENPRSQGLTKLVEYESLYRLRAADYRIFFEIQESDKFILIVKVGHRREIYRK